MKKVISKLFMFIMVFFCAICLTSCGSELTPEKVIEIVEKVDTERDYDYLEFNTIIYNEDGKATKEAEVLVQPTAIYLAQYEYRTKTAEDETTTTEKVLTTQTKLIKTETDGKYLTYTKNEGASVSTEEITEEIFTNTKTEIRSTYFGEALPKDIDHIISGESVASGLANVDIYFYNSTEAISMVKLTKIGADRGFTKNYRIAELFVYFTEPTIVDPVEPTPDPEPSTSETPSTSSETEKSTSSDSKEEPSTSSSEGTVVDPEVKAAKKKDEKKIFTYTKFKYPLKATAKEIPNLI